MWTREEGEDGTNSLVYFLMEMCLQVIMTRKRSQGLADKRAGGKQKKGAPALGMPLCGSWRDRPGLLAQEACPASSELCAKRIISKKSKNLGFSDLFVVHVYHLTGSKRSHPEFWEFGFAFDGDKNVGFWLLTITSKCCVWTRSKDVDSVLTKTVGR